MSDLVYNKFKGGILQGSYALGVSTFPIYVALVNNSYSPNIDSDLYATTPLVYQIVGTGYTAGGLALSSPHIVQDNTRDRGQIKGTEINFCPHALRILFYLP